MKVRIWTDKRYKEPEIVICTDKRTRYIDSMRETILHTLNMTLTGYQKDISQILLCEDIIRIYTEDDKVMAQCISGIYYMKEKLYELENMLGTNNFIRISRSEIVNLKRIEKLDTSLTGTIKMHLSGNIITYVSRRNVKRIKEALG